MGHFFSLQIREESNTKIDLPAENSNSETIVITGKRANCEAARHRILAIQKELVSDLLWMRDLKMMIEYINTQEIVVVWNSREEINRSVSLFLALKPKFLQKLPVAGEKSMPVVSGSSFRDVYFRSLSECK